MAVLFVFMDGVGIGPNDPERNPFARASIPTLRQILGGRGPFMEEGLIVSDHVAWIPTDAALGVPGLPQSATGQTTILTGKNAAQTLGQHWGPWPDAALRNMLENGNLFQKVQEQGGKVSYVNAFPQRYFEDMAAGRRNLSAIPFAAQAAGLPLLKHPDLLAGKAISAELTNRGWRENLGYPDTPLITPEEAGARFHALSREFDLVFFEYWLTDFAGHRRWDLKPEEIIQGLDQFLAGITHNFDEKESLLILTSDHGNLEDLSTKLHTMNPVPTLLVGKGSEEIAPKIKSLPDIMPALLDCMAKHKSEEVARDGGANSP